MTKQRLWMLAAASAAAGALAGGPEAIRALEANPAAVADVQVAQGRGRGRQGGGQGGIVPAPARRAGEGRRGRDGRAREGACANGK